jgi:hypothetical protein
MAQPRLPTSLDNKNEKRFRTENREKRLIVWLKGIGAFVIVAIMLLLVGIVKKINYRIKTHVF